MNVGIGVSELRALVNRASRAAGDDRSVPAQRFVRLTAADGLSLHAACTALSLLVTGAARVRTRGGIGVDAKSLRDAVSVLPDGPCALTIEGNGRLRLVAGKRKAEIPGVPESECQLIPDAEGSESLNLNGPRLRRILAGSRHASGKDPKYPIIEGTGIEYTGALARAWCTDGKRFAARQEQDPTPAMPPVVLPPRLVAELLEDSSELVVLRASDTAVSATLDGAVVCATRIRGEFPHVERQLLVHVSQTPATKVQVARADMLDAAKAARAIVGTWIRLRCDGAALSVTDVGESDGKVEEDIAAKLSGAPLNVRVDSTYLADALGSLHGTTVTIEYDGGRSALIVRGDGAAVEGMMPRGET